MDANYLFDVFEKTETEGLNDLLLGLSAVNAEKPIPEIDQKELASFIGYYYEELVEAFKARDREKFVETANKLNGQERKPKSTVILPNRSFMEFRPENAGKKGVMVDGYAVDYDERGYVQRAIRSK